MILDKEQQETADSLMALLGLETTDIEKLLNKTPKKIKVKKTKIDIADQEYTLERTETCLTCQTKTIRVFLMKQYLKENMLYSKEVDANPGSMETKKESVPCKTCGKCMENLCLLEKEDLASMYLEALNNRGV